MEIWLPLNGYPNYEVSSRGSVRNRKTGKILKTELTNAGYRRVVLYNGTSHVHKSVHRLVSEAFYGPRERMEVNHIDGDKSNNFVLNLEWCTAKENMRHAVRAGLKQPSGPHSQIRVRIVETGDVYDSIADCARAIDGSHEHIRRILKGYPGRHSHLGYHFEKVED